MFAKLGDIIARRYKLIIVLWIVVLFYVYPLIFKISDVVVYNEAETGLEGLEAMQAQDLIDQNFAGQIPPSTIMLVIQNDNVLSLLSSEVKDFTYSLYQDISNDGGLQGVASVNYLYGSIEGYLAQVAYQTAPVAYMLYGQANQTAQMVYGTPLFIVQLHMNLYLSYGGSVPEAQIYQWVMENITRTLTLSGADSQTMLLTLGYANAFYSVWNGTYEADLPDLQPMIGQASALHFFDKGDAGMFALAVADGLDVYNFTSQATLTELTLGMVSAQSGMDPGFLEQVWALGPAPTLAQAYGLSHSIVFAPGSDYYDLPRVPSFLVEQFVNVYPESGPANNTMLMVIPLTVNGSSAEAEQNVRVLRDIVRTHLASVGPGYSVYVSGDPALTVDMMDAVDKDTSRIDPVTVMLVLLLVGAYFRSAVTPWIPLMTVGMAYLTSTALIYLMGTYVLSIHYSVLTMVLTVMLGAGTDYCIFIMSRYREERVMGRSKEEAVKTSLTWAGESIATSGATVMIGFGSLMIGEYTLVRSMGMALVIAVGMALAFALTMLPSLLMLVGDKVFWPNKMVSEAARFKKRDQSGGGYFRKSARFSLKHRRAIVLTALLISVPAVYLVFSLESSYDFIAGLPSAESKKGIDALGAGFGEGTILPTYIVVQFEDEAFVNGSLTPSAASQLESYCALVNSTDNVRSVSGPTRPFGTYVNESYLASLPEDERATYEMVILGTVGDDNRTFLLTVVLQDEPFTTKSIHTIDDIRTIQDDNQAFDSGTVVLVGGSTASMTDVSRSVSLDFATMRIVVLIGIFLVLMVVLGSLLIPVRLILTVLLSVSWTIAMTMIIFQVINGVPVLWMMPLILFVVAMGLGMDYDIFLTTRIREEVAKGKTDEQAIMTAVERTGGIITACGLVMAGAFGSMMLSSTALLQEFGFGLSFAILLDAMIVRIYVVPAIMLMLQKWNWYAPGRLQRVRRGEKARKH